MTQSVWSSQATVDHVQGLACCPICRLPGERVRLWNDGFLTQWHCTTCQHAYFTRRILLASLGTGVRAVHVRAPVPDRPRLYRPDCPHCGAGMLPGSDCGFGCCVQWSCAYCHARIGIPLPPFYRLTANADQPIWQAVDLSL